MRAHTQNLYIIPKVEQFSYESLHEQMMNIFNTYLGCIIDNPKDEFISFELSQMKYKPKKQQTKNQH